MTSHKPCYLLHFHTRAPDTASVEDDPSAVEKKKSIIFNPLQSSDVGNAIFFFTFTVTGLKYTLILLLAEATDKVIEVMKNLIRFSINYILCMVNAKHVSKHGVTENKSY